MGKNEPMTSAQNEEQIDSDYEEENQSDDERDVVSPEEFKTLELTLDEARRQYDDEESRREAVEGKIGIVVTVDALLISVVALFADTLNPFVRLVVLAPALASTVIGLYAIRSRHYDRPGKAIEDFHDYSEFENVGDQREQLLLDYVVSTVSNKGKNDPKYKIFNVCIMLTFISLLLVFAIPVADFFGVIEWITDQAIALLRK